jgi:hypothetical protein
LFGSEHGVGFGFGILARHNASCRLASINRAAPRSPRANAPDAARKRQSKTATYRPCRLRQRPRVYLPEMSTPPVSAQQAHE